MCCEPRQLFLYLVLSRTIRGKWSTFTSEEFSFFLQKLTLKQALSAVLQWCFHPNFSVRLYALVALKKIWSVCKMWHIEEFGALTSIVESSLNQVENMHGVG